MSQEFVHHRSWPARIGLQRLSGVPMIRHMKQTMRGGRRSRREGREQADKRGLKDREEEQDGRTRWSDKKIYTPGFQRVRRFGCGGEYVLRL